MSELGGPRVSEGTSSDETKQRQDHKEARPRPKGFHSQRHRITGGSKLYPLPRDAVPPPKGHRSGLHNRPVSRDERRQLVLEHIVSTGGITGSIKPRPATVTGQTRMIESLKPRSRGGSREVAVAETNANSMLFGLGFDEREVSQQQEHGCSHGVIDTTGRSASMPVGATAASSTRHPALIYTSPMGLGINVNSLRRPSVLQPRPTVVEATPIHLAGRQQQQQAEEEEEEREEKEGQEGMAPVVNPSSTTGVLAPARATPGTAIRNSSSMQPRAGNTRGVASPGTDPASADYRGVAFDDEETSEGVVHSGGNGAFPVVLTSIPPWDLLDGAAPTGLQFQRQNYDFYDFDRAVRQRERARAQERSQRPLGFLHGGARSWGLGTHGLGEAAGERTREALQSAALRHWRAAKVAQAKVSAAEAEQRASNSPSRFRSSLYYYRLKKERAQIQFQEERKADRVEEKRRKAEHEVHVEKRRRRIRGEVERHRSAVVAAREHYAEHLEKQTLEGRLQHRRRLFILKKAREAEERSVEERKARQKAERIEHAERMKEVLGTEVVGRRQVVENWKVELKKKELQRVHDREEQRADLRSQNAQRRSMLWRSLRKALEKNHEEKRSIVAEVAKEKVALQNVRKRQKERAILAAKEQAAKITQELHELQLRRKKRSEEALTKRDEGCGDESPGGSNTPLLSPVASPVQRLTSRSLSLSPSSSAPA